MFLLTYFLTTAKWTTIYLCDVSVWKQTEKPFSCIDTDDFVEEYVSDSYSESSNCSWDFSLLPVSHLILGALLKYYLVLR